MMKLFSIEDFENALQLYHQLISCSTIEEVKQKCSLIITNTSFAYATYFSELHMFEVSNILDYAPHIDDETDIKCIYCNRYRIRDYGRHNKRWIYDLSFFVHIVNEILNNNNLSEVRKLFKSDKRNHTLFVEQHQDFKGIYFHFYAKWNHDNFRTILVSEKEYAFLSELSINVNPDLTVEGYLQVHRRCENFVFDSLEADHLIEFFKNHIRKYSQKSTGGQNDVIFCGRF